MRRRLWWFVHNAVAHPLIALAGPEPREWWGQRFHDWTGRW